MKKAMLGGSIHSGKTKTLDNLVADGYMGLLFTENLKILAAKMFQAIADDIGELITYDDLRTTQKTRARPFLAELGVFLGIDDHPRWAKWALVPWYQAKCPPAVVESIRTPAQYRAFKKHGFELVWLDVEPADQERRARALGHDPLKLTVSGAHWSESHSTFLRKHAKLVLNTSRLSPKEVAEAIKAALDGSGKVFIF